MSDYDGGFKVWCEQYLISWNSILGNEKYRYLTLSECMRDHFVQTIFEMDNGGEIKFESPKEAAIYAYTMLKKLMESYHYIKREADRKK